MGTEGISIPRGVKNVDAAWEFLKWMGGPEGNLMFNKLAYKQPALYEIADDPFFYESPAQAAFMEIAECGFNRPAIPEGILLWTELLAADDNAIHHRGEPQELLDAVAEKVDSAMQQWL